MKPSKGTGLPARRVIAPSEPREPSRWAAYSAWRRERIASGDAVAGGVSEDSEPMIDLTDPDSDTVIDLTDPD